jgi:hypothetical protein
MPAIDHGADVLQRAVFLAKVAGLLEVPIWGTEQNPAKLGSNDPLVRQLCQKTFGKTSFDASQSALAQALRPPAKAGGNARSLPKHLQKSAPSEPARGTIVLAGVEAHVCLLQTALGLVEQEFDVWVVTDACGSRRERDRDAAFDRLAGNGVELVTSEMVAFEWMQDCEHPKFRDVLELIKA